MRKYVVLICLIFLTGCTINNNVNIYNDKENNTNANSVNDNKSNEENNKIDDSIIDNNTDIKDNSNNYIYDDVISNDIKKNDDIINNNEIVDTTNIENEEDVVNYFVNLKDDIKTKLSSDTWDNVKNFVIEKLNIAYGFCFKGEEIGGYTLSELSDSAKEKILNIVFEIDSFIESKSPGYKAQFKESYDNMIDSAKQSLGIIKDKITDFFTK